MKKTLALTLAALLCAGALCACGGGAPSASAPLVAPSSSKMPQSGAPPQHAAVTLTVAAAASLENSYVEKLIPMFTKQYPHVTVEGSYDSSGKLQTQIEEGLAADVFMSAAEKQMNALEAGGFIDGGSVVRLLENEIVLIVPAGSSAGIAAFEDITKAATVALGDPASVPAGQYAEEALASLGLWDAVKAKASFGTNVTEVLNWVAEGSADAGIVYATDAAQMPDKVQVVAATPAGSLAAPVIYPVGILCAAPQREAAELFVAFLQTPEAMKVFEDAGFKPNT